MDFQLNSSNQAMEWPYPIKFRQVRHETVDVLVIGVGIVGAAAGLRASKRGLKVAVVDKAPIKHSGCGGAGLDHYNHIFDNPVQTPVTPEEYMARAVTKSGKQGHGEYIQLKGSWEFLLELEELGLPIRDEDDDFAGTATRNEETKMLKAYDYKNFINVKLRGGQYIKVVQYYALKKAGVQMYERWTATSILTEGGKIGGRAVGATCLSLDTGEMVVFHAKSIILATGGINGLWQFSTELTGSSFKHDPNDNGDGFALMWKAGGQGKSMYHNGQTWGAHPLAWPRFGVGNPYNTWFPCSIVDNNGKEIPWQDFEGDPIESFEARNLPVKGQPYIGMDSNNTASVKGTVMPKPVYDLPDRIRKGEFELPLWADLPGIPKEERRSIWGMMVGNEGKTRYTLFDLYTRYGFNPDKDMLQAPDMAPDGYKSGGWFQGEPNAIRAMRSEYMHGIGEVAVDWNLMTSVPGLFAAGAVSVGGGAAGGSVGNYAGNRASEFAGHHELGEIDEAQLNAEIERVYAPVDRAGKSGNYVSWKEMWAGTARVMQQEVTDEENLTVYRMEHGIKWLESIRNSEMQHTYARNPHELARVLECESRLMLSEVVMNTIIAELNAKEEGIMEEKPHMFSQLDENGEFKALFEEDKYWLKAPWAPTYEENYENCRALEKEVY